MQECITPPHVIARRNSPIYIRLRITGQYLLLYLLAFVFGIVFCSLLDINSLPALTPYVEAHFDRAMNTDASLLARICTVIEDAGANIRSMLFILTAGFTMFCPLALSLQTVWRGFSLGFTSSYLCAAITEGMITMDRAPAAFLLFLGANVLIAASFVELSAQAVIFSHRYREICARPRMILTAPFVRQYLFHYLTIFGFVLIVNFLYASLSSFLF
ncbi:MAG: hypothetical protein IJF49_03150 [Clostridia bacterium]|nr:hypothetical protein [Clostridia bacterium]